MTFFNPTRRQFVSSLAASGAALLAPRRSQPQTSERHVDPRVAKIVAQTIAIDMHSHVQLRYPKNPADPIPLLDVDLTGEIKRGGFSAVCQTYALDAVGGVEPGNDYAYYLQSLAFEDRLLQQNRMRRALNLKDLETAHAQQQPIIVQAVEGAHFVEGHLERIEVAYKRGLRHLQIVHERDNSGAPIGDVFTAPAHLGGLTPFGAQVIKECNRLGLLVDLAHGTPETVTGALKATAQPIIVSHTSLARETDNEDMRRRLISKELARAIADAGGVVGVWWRMNTSTQEYVASIKAMVDAIGAHHVGIGTDTDLTAAYVLPYTNQLWPDMNGGFFYAVAGEMLKQGFSPDEISKIGGGNFCRVFGRITATRA